MRKFMKWVKKKFFGDYKSGNFPPPPPTEYDYNWDVGNLEKRIDEIVLKTIPMMGNLINFKPDTRYWQSVFKALAYAESGFKLNCRYVEPPSLGKDAITGIQNTSEGLLQLSYQDSKYHSCDFEWNVDKNKSSFDLTKTIFDIEKNITCGMQIMNKLVGKKGHYIFNDGNYWAVLKPKNNRHVVFLDRFNKYLRAV